MNSLENFVMTYIFTYSFIFVFKKLGNYKDYNLFYEVNLMIFLSLLETLLVYICPDFLRLGIYYLILSFGIYLVYSKNKSRFFKIYIITFGIFHLSDVVVGYTLYEYTNILDTYSFLGDIFFEVLIIFMAVLIASLLRKINILNLRNDIILEENKILWLHTIFIIIIFATIIYSFEYVNADISMNKFILFFILIFLCCILVSYVIFSFLNKLYIEKNEKKNIQLYANMIEESLENIRKFKYDYRNILMCISGYISSNNMEGLKKYFYENLVNDKYMDVNIYGLINIKNIPVKGLISIKLAKAVSLGLNLSLNIVNDIEDFILKDIDICKILGILIDNAVEASIESDVKMVNIGIGNDEDEIYIIISNSFKTKPEINRIFEKGYSTKGNDRGLGLDIVRKLNKKYHNMYMNTYIKDNLFHQEIAIVK
ncbi:sensor histidine kinase [Tepidibacter formicigenes]|jgi:two-component system sensor histidine kinase AgrC|uniref:Two-component system, AgrA family, sensor histidine kinase AgrC n=1 Tax=Tepidibacter formicigenes DSM 15518 TaxID=1123349 RepID=A0A1M6TCN9_9FIRM|nr:GHKL domain-containing protein [Tepidibacter formicigenes]SHK54538.1 two-component system, AgrA family, sensor histidine kinase AgrC [Tepidibacter formicigenes DSM 15518]